MTSVNVGTPMTSRKRSPLYSFKNSLRANVPVRTPDSQAKASLINLSIGAGRFSRSWHAPLTKRVAATAGALMSICLRLSRVDSRAKNSLNLSARLLSEGERSLRVTPSFIGKKRILTAKKIFVNRLKKSLRKKGGGEGGHMNAIRHRKTLCPPSGSGRRWGKNCGSENLNVSVKQCCQVDRLSPLRRRRLFFDFLFLHASLRYFITDGHLCRCLHLRHASAQLSQPAAETFLSQVIHVQSLGGYEAVIGIFYLLLIKFPKGLALKFRSNPRANPLGRVERAREREQQGVIRHRRTSPNALTTARLST